MAKRIPSFSLMRVLGSLAVVLLHSFYGAAGVTADPRAGQALACRNLLLWAVPLFVMVTGALLLDPRRELGLRRLFRRYVGRVLAALALVSLLTWGFDALLLGQRDPLAALLALYTGAGWSHLWYLYLLLALYLLLPFARMVTDRANHGELLYLLALLFVFLCLLPLLNSLTGVKAGFYLCVSTVYPLYLFLGYALDEEELRLPRPLALLLLPASTGLLLFLSLRAGPEESAPLNRLLSSYAFLPVVLQAVSLFSLLQDWDPEEDGFFCRLVAFLDRRSFGIYLLHMFPLKYLLVVRGLDPLGRGGLPLALLTGLGCYLFSLLVTWLLQLLPGVKRLL